MPGPGPGRVKRRAWVRGPGSWTVATAVAVILTASLASCAPRAVAPLPDSAVAARVDGKAITVSELAVFMSTERSAVVAAHPEVGAGSDAWYSRTKGPSPADRLVAAALRDAVRLRATMRLAEQLRVDAPTTFDQLIEARDVENARRVRAVAAGQPIYGPRQYTRSAWLIYATGELEFTVQTALTQRGQIATDDATLQRFLGAHRAEFGSDLSAVREQVRLAVVHSAFERRITEATASATITQTPVLTDLRTQPCVAAGTC